MTRNSSALTLPVVRLPETVAHLARYSDSACPGADISPSRAETCASHLRRIPRAPRPAKRRDQPARHPEERRLPRARVKKRGFVTKQLENKGSGHFGNYVPNPAVPSLAPDCLHERRRRPRQLCRLLRPDQLSDAEKKFSPIPATTKPPYAAAPASSSRNWSAATSRKRSSSPRSTSAARRGIQAGLPGLS